MRRLGHRVSHLVKRFWWAVSAKPVTPEDRMWVESNLRPGELALFDRMSRADQEHHLRVARRFVAGFESAAAPDRAWVAAALMHDVGKLVCGLGTCGRVFATLWPCGRRGDGRIGRYYRHVAIGAALAREAGSDPVTVSLVGEWPDAPAAAAVALHRADDL